MHSGYIEMTILLGFSVITQVFPRLVDAKKKYLFKVLQIEQMAVYIFSICSKLDLFHMQ